MSEWHILRQNLLNAMLDIVRYLKARNQDCSQIESLIKELFP